MRQKTIAFENRILMWIMIADKVSMERRLNPYSLEQNLRAVVSLSVTFTISLKLEDNLHKVSA